VPAAPTAKDGVSLPADMAPSGGTCSQNMGFHSPEVPCFEVGQISWIRPWRNASSNFGVPDCVAAQTAKDDVSLPGDMAASGAPVLKIIVFRAQGSHALRRVLSVR
jgi:hypothetical protein